MKGKVRSKLVGIQALRGIAALLVVFGHTEGMVEGFLGLPAGNWFSFGQSGVDIFFVISGFIIVYVTPRPLTSLRDLGTFLFRRMARIYPAYWALTLPALFWRYWKGSFAHGQHEWRAWIFLLPYHAVPPIIVAWTLVYEIHFYLVCAAILFLPGRYRMVAAAAWFFVVMTANVLQLNVWNFYTSWWLAPYPVEFIAGMFLAHWAANGSSVHVRPAVAALLMGTAYVFMMTYVAREGFFDFGGPALLRMLVLGLPAFLIVGLVYQMEIQGDWAWMKRLVPLGDRSYSIYLLHLPVLAMGFFHGTKLASAHTMAMTVLILLVSIGVLAFLVELSYRLIERPCQLMAKRFAPHTELVAGHSSQR